MGIETELKLQITPEQVEPFLQHPLVQSEGALKHLHNIYFDTADCALLKRGVGLRIRKMDDKQIQTLKTVGNSVGGLHQRQEWEIEIAGETPNFDQLPPEILPLFTDIDLKKIEAIFTTDFNRQTWQLQGKSGEQVELALDLGKITTPLTSESLHEIELELQSGSLAYIYQTALALQKGLSLTIENRSKAERGYALYQPKTLHFHKATPLTLTHTMTTEQVFSTLAWSCLSHLQANEEMVLFGTDPEGVHQMRVALRRLRTLLNLYTPLIHNQRKLLKGLKRVAKVLGSARDWDVFADAVHVIQQQLPKSSLLKTLKKMIVQQQQCTYTQVQTLLRSPDYSRLLLKVSCWLTEQSWRTQCTTDELAQLDQPILEFAHKTLQKYQHEVDKQGKPLTTLNAKQRHNLRIAVKELADSVRFFTSLYPPESVLIYRKLLSRLQDELGVLNDTRVALRLLNQLNLAVDAPSRYLLRGWYGHQHMIHMKHLTETWCTFSKQTPFWQY